MKKLLLFMLGTVFLTSCSSDTQESVTYDDTAVVINSTTQDQLMLKSTIDPVLKQLYIEMINSQSYIDYDNAREAFNDKLGTTIPDSEMSSSNKMLSWVQNNITQTGFQNYQEVVSKWDDISTLGIVAIEDNLNFHQYIAGTVSNALTPILDESIIVPTDCSACVTGFMNCINVAHQEYSNTAADSASQFVSGGMSSSGFLDYQEEISIAYIRLQRAISNCDYAFDKCCKGGL